MYCIILIDICHEKLLVLNMRKIVHVHVYWFLSFVFLKLFYGALLGLTFLSTGAP